MATVRRAKAGIRILLNTGGTERLALKYSQRINLLGSERVADILRKAGDELVAEYQKNIARMKPGPVQDLSPAYKKRKAKLVGRVYPILVRSGHMAKNITRRVESKPWRIRIIFGGGIHPDAEMPTKRLAQIHIEGDPMIHLPPRDFTKVSAAWRKQWVERIRSRIRRLG